jgi:hypothetical protein
MRDVDGLRVEHGNHTIKVDRWQSSWPKPHEVVGLDIQYFSRSMVKLDLDHKEAILLGKYLIELGMNALEVEEENDSSETRTIE